MIFVDTNYFLRFLLNDSVQYKIAKNLFLQASRGKVKLNTSIIVMFEVYWVLISYYERKKLDVVETLLKLLQLNFSFEEKELFINSLTYFRDHNLSLEDCYNLYFAKSKNIKIFKTFDRKLLKSFEDFKD